MKATVKITVNNKPPYNITDFPQLYWFTNKNNNNLAAKFDTNKKRIEIYRSNGSTFFVPTKSKDVNEVARWVYSYRFNQGWED